MSSKAIQDFLTKKLFIERDIVTYRSLSRELAIHVNVAKNELAAYHANATKPVTATYIITAEVPVLRMGKDANSMQLDDAVDDEGEGGEYVPQTRIVLVPEANLAGVMSQLTNIRSTHVYGLSPSPVRDAGLLCGPTDIVRQIDNSKKGVELGLIVGKVIGAHVQMKAGGKTAPQIASLSKTTSSAVFIPLSKDKDHVNDEDTAKETQTKIKQKDKAPLPIMEKSKLTGKLDFSRGNTKDSKKEPQKKTVAEASASGAKSQQEPGQKLAKEEPKRGTKRKSGGRVLLSDSDDTSSVAPVPRPSKPQTRLTLRKGVVLSDEEDVPLKASNRKGRLASAAASEAESESEPSLRAMMDIDDDQVIRVSRLTSTVQEGREDEEKSEEDSEVQNDIDDPAPKPKPKTRKKKVVPVGRNGLKKKRLVKSRQTTDNKGYFLTEDYSSYESVDEEELGPEEPPKGKGKKAPSGSKGKEDDEKKTSKAKAVVKEPGAPNKPRKSTKTKSEQKSLMNFFGPPKIQK